MNVISVDVSPHYNLNAKKGVLDMQTLKTA